GYGTDYQPVFGEVPDGWKERWRLLREFAERWCEQPMEDAGASLKKGRNKEEKRTHALLAASPPSLREWVAVTRALDWGESGPELGANESHELQDFDEVICFLNFDCNRTVFYVGKDPGNPDPPVEWTWVSLESGSFPHLTTFAFQYLMAGWENGQV